MKNETKHTPWKVQDNRIIQRFYNESWNKQVPTSFDDVEIGKFNSCEQAELAARAVNAHEELVETLRFLRQTIHQAYEHEGPIEKCPKNTCDAATQAIARAEGR